jgi:hypothetical protein
MADNVEPVKEGFFKPRPKLSPSEEYERSAVTALVLFTALMGFFVPKNMKATAAVADAALKGSRGQSSQASNLAAMAQPPAAAKVAAGPFKAPATMPVAELLKANFSKEQIANLAQEKAMKSEILKTINDGSNLLDANTIQPHLLALGLSIGDHTAAEIVEAYKIKAMQCNPELLDEKDPSRSEHEAKFAAVRNSFRLLMKNKEALSKQNLNK